MAKFSNQSRLRKKLRQFPNSLTANIRPAIEAGASELADAIETAAPRDKGDLAAAAHYTVSRDGLAAKIGYGDVAGFKRQWKKGGFVAVFKEFGTRHDPASPFIRPTYRANLPAILKRVDDAVRLTLRKASDGYF